MADVAKLAKVSLSTVSRVINRREVVNVKTRERVESAIEKLGYHPNAFARGLMLRRSEILGLVLPDLHGEFYSEIIRGANYRARELGYSLMVSSARDGDDSHSLLKGIRLRSLLDGVAVMVSEMTDRMHELLADLPVPFVMLDEDVEARPHDSVIIDQHAGAQALMDHLVERCEARRIIFVGGLATNLDTLARLETYRKSLARHQMKVDERDIHFLNYEYETAYKHAGKQVLDWAGPHTCVFAANDEMAAGIIAAAQAAGVTVPERLGVVGFDDTRIARMVRPFLTTVRVPMFDLGAKAVELLTERIQKPDREPCQICLTPELVVRESCGFRRRG